jgi:GNAT superfamily N-acetyltransferase
MSASPDCLAITIRSAVAADAEGIANAFLESAEQHAGFDPERYWLPPIETVSARYREPRQRRPDADEVDITLVAELKGEIVGFADARLERSPDPMHREMIYCHVAEIAVSRRHRNRGIGRQLLRAVEEWGSRHGAAFASLEYHAANASVSAFYRRSGYSVASITSIKRL